ncbi:MAG: hypothetical protein IPK14_18230 [Blastocatellia bacterium]|nr:hypothetical protein [Blastocatellia bacterium]
MGAYIHSLKYDEVIIHPNKPVVAQSVEKPLANIEQRNKVYSALLNEFLQLSLNHADNLLNVRGLSDERIFNNLYATLPIFPNIFKLPKN